MSQRDSGYERKPLDSYETPAWVTEALLPHLPPVNGDVWEPAAGSGKMVDALRANGFIVYGTDIAHDPSVDFLQSSAYHFHAIITNPPYTDATLFAAHALMLTCSIKGSVALLLRTDFDHAKGRRSLFAEHKAFAKKVVLTKRIKWFDDSKGQPSFNHAWFIWDWKHQGPPTLAYGP